MTTEPEYVSTRLRSYSIVTCGVCNKQNTFHTQTLNGIPVCDDCGMSRHHSEWYTSDWIMIEDIEATRQKMQEGINRLLKKAY